jgi:hypothetical protein
MSAMTWDYETTEHVFRTHMQPLAEIKPAPVDWIWPRYLAAGTVTTLSGEPGAGKTYLALAIAAALTSGKLPDNNRRRRAQDVLYLNGDDSPSQVLRPRFDSLGGDPQHLHLLTYSLQNGDSAELSEEAAAKLAAEQGFQNLLDSGDATNMTLAQLAAIDPSEFCEWDDCPGSCKKCDEFDRLLESSEYTRSQLDEFEGSQDEQTDTDNRPDPLSLTLEKLAEALRQTKARLLIVDSLDSQWRFRRFRTFRRFRKC